jgi:hypothetical protein
VETSGDELEYFQRRAEEELERAQSSSVRVAVAAHFKMAELYLERIARMNDASPAELPDEPEAEG